MYSYQNIDGVSAERKNGMKKIDVMNKVITQAFKNGFYLGIDWEEFSDLEKVVMLRSIVQDNGIYLMLIFDKTFAKALWGDTKYMAYYAGYNEWADATVPEPDYSDFDEIQHDCMPLFEYHLMMLARSENRFKYLEENV